MADKATKVGVGAGGGVLLAAVIAALVSTGILTPEQALTYEDFELGRTAELEPTPVEGKLFTIPSRVSLLKNIFTEAGITGLVVSAVAPPPNFPGDFYVDPDMLFVNDTTITGYEHMRLNQVLSTRLRTNGYLTPNEAPAWTVIFDQEIKMHGGLTFGEFEVDEDTHTTELEGGEVTDKLKGKFKKQGALRVYPDTVVTTEIPGLRWKVKDSYREYQVAKAAGGKLRIFPGKLKHSEVADWINDALER